ncbi:hypothetical protein CGRA01v4_03564 [Colletotrichum graminicola]|nr:hypothetical protein CGRA01v4_03564 [Colletotrichum graminicola]
MSLVLWISRLLLYGYLGLNRIGALGTSRPLRPKPSVPLPTVSLLHPNPAPQTVALLPHPVVNLLELNYIRIVSINIMGEDTPALAILAPATNRRILTNSQFPTPNTSRNSILNPNPNHDLYPN